MNNEGVQSLYTTALRHRLYRCIERTRELAIAVGHIGKFNEVPSWLRSKKMKQRQREERGGEALTMNPLFLA